MIEALIAKTFLGSIFEFWNRLPSSIKVLIIIAVVGLGGYAFGHSKGFNKADIYWRAQLQKSIDEAKRVDTTANSSAYREMEKQKDYWQSQSIDVKNKLSEGSIAFNQLKERCLADDDFLKKNSDIDELLNGSNRLPKYGVPGSKEKSPRN